MRTVSTRLVFYISGFDPRGVAWYHGLYRRESEKQAAVGGMVISVGSRRRLGKIVSGWPVAGADAGGRSTFAGRGQQLERHVAEGEDRARRTVGFRAP